VGSPLLGHAGARDRVGRLLRWELMHSRCVRPGTAITTELEGCKVESA
jgi:hypothetical protein